MDGLVVRATPLLSRPRRHFRASYIFKALRSTLFTITDCKERKERHKHESIVVKDFKQFYAVGNYQRNYLQTSGLNFKRANQGSTASKSHINF